MTDRSALLFAIAAIGACATHKHPGPFPHPEVLSSIAARARPTIESSKFGVVSEFTVSGPFPEGWSPTSPLGDLLGDVLVSSLPNDKHRATAAGQCVARSVLPYVMQAGKNPPSPLFEYIQARCRAVWVGGGSSFFISKGGGKMTFEERVEGLKPPLVEAIRRVAEGPGPVEYGLAAVGDEERVVAMLVYGGQKAVIDGVERSEDGGRFTIRGRLLVASERVVAKVNRGPVGVDTCRIDPDIPLPSFVATCSATVADDEAWLDIGAFSPNRFLAERVASLLISPSGQAPSVYRSPRQTAGSGALASGQDLELRILAVVDDLRRQAGLQPLQLDRPQSAVAASLAAHYFASAYGVENRDELERIALGVRAGWSIKGSVRYGAFTSAMTARTLDPTYLAAALIARPFSREVLIDPDVTRIAIAGIWQPKDEVAGVVVSTYAMFDGMSKDALTETAWTDLVAQREARGRPVPRRWKALAAERAAVAEAVIQDSLTTEAALHRLSNAYATETGMPLRGFWIEANRLDDLPWPRELLMEPAPVLDLVGAYRQPDGEPWSRFVVLVLLKGTSQVAHIDSNR